MQTFLPLFEVKYPAIELKSETQIPNIDNGNYTVEEYASAFINGMGETQKQRFKKMLENGIQCGLSVAQNYGIDYDDFITDEKVLALKEKLYTK